MGIKILVIIGVARHFKVGGQLYAARSTAQNISSAAQIDGGFPSRAKRGSSVKQQDYALHVHAHGCRITVSTSHERLAEKVGGPVPPLAPP